MKALTRNGAAPDNDGLPELPPHLSEQIVYLEAIFAAYPGPDTALKRKARKQLERIEKWADVSSRFYLSLYLAIERLKNFQSKILTRRIRK